LDLNWLVTPLVLIGVVGIPVALVIGYTRGRARVTRNPQIEAQYLRAGFTVGASRAHGGLIVSGNLLGLPFLLTANPGSRYAPAASSVTVPAAAGADFLIEREGSRDLSGNDLVESLFPDAKARDAVRALFGLGFSHVARGGGRLSATRLLDASPLEPDTLRAVLEQLAALGATPGPQAGATLAAKPREVAQVAALGLGLGALILGGFALALVADKSTQSLTEGMIGQVWPGVLAAFLALTVLAHRLLRGRPQAGVELFAFVALGLPALGGWAWGGAMLANQFLDESVAREHVVAGSRPNRIRRGGEYRYFVNIDSPKAGGRGVTIEVSGAYRDAKAGQRWIVRTRSGRLGFEWVESARPAGSS
jgi:hypothetical protein